MIAQQQKRDHHEDEMGTLDWQCYTVHTEWSQLFLLESPGHTNLDLGRSFWQKTHAWSERIFLNWMLIPQENELFLAYIFTKPWIRDSLINHSYFNHEAKRKVGCPPDNTIYCIGLHLHDNKPNQEWTNTKANRWWGFQP